MSDFGWWGAAADTFEEFTLISGVTPGSNGSTASTITTNTESWSSGDRLIVIGAGVRNASRTFNTPSPNWAGASETWTEHLDDAAVVTTFDVSAGIASAVAQSSETDEDCDLSWNDTLYNRVGALLVCAGDSIIRQATPAGKTEDTGTTVTATFGAATLATSQIVTFCSQYSNSDTLTVPGGFTLLANSSPSTNARTKIAARIGFAGTDVAWTLATTADLPKIAGAIEIARPGDEL